MIGNQKHIKVPCGGWILEREANAHIKRCEMCEAMLDYKDGLFDNRVSTIITVILVIGAFLALWAIISFSTEPLLLPL